MPKILDTIAATQCVRRMCIHASHVWIEYEDRLVDTTRAQFLDDGIIWTKRGDDVQLMQRTNGFPV